jgi:hypothetical protein
VIVPVGETDWDPLVAEIVPTPWLMTALVALVMVQLSVELPPAEIVVGFAVKVILGFGVGLGGGGGGGLGLPVKVKTAVTTALLFMPAFVPIALTVVFVLSVNGPV